MLSRAAERVYWTGRYLERAENTARIVQQHSQLFLDLPAEAGVRWSELVKIFGATEAFASSRQNLSEEAILHYLLADSNSDCSLVYCLAMTRENIRNSRDLLPQESWENINELYRDGREQLRLAAAGDNRFEILADCIGRCQQINGILTGTMSHHSPYHFLVLGQSIERADMTSRIIDVAAAYIQHNERLVSRYGSTLWTNVLKSVSGFQMYRQYCQPQVEGFRVIGFLLRDAEFPRAVRACVDTASRSAAALPNANAAIEAFSAARDLIDSEIPEQLRATSVSNLMDTLQKRLATAHRAIVETWFLPGQG